jgi:hypothetical protein
VVWGEEKRPDHGEAEVAGAGKEGAAALEIFGRCRARARVQMGWGCSLLGGGATLACGLGERGSPAISRGPLRIGEEGGEGEEGR